MHCLFVLTLMMTLTLASQVKGQEDENSSSLICPGGCLDDPGTTEFYCVKSECTEFPFSEINDIESTTYIDVSFNDITSVPVMSFPALTFLDLSNNFITNISVFAFQECPKLLTLNLSMNQLTTVAQRVFLGMKNLETLHLDHNLIYFIEPNTFYYLDSLIQLNLSYNNIANLTYNALTDLKELEILHLEGNKFPHLSAYYFQGLTNLQYLSLRQNAIETIEHDTFAHLDALLRLDLGGNKIKGINASIFHTGARHPFSSLQAIHLDNNNLHVIFNQTFSPLSHLQYVFLDNNPILILGHVKQFPKSIKLISMQKNTKLQKIRNGTFQGLGNLTDVSFSGSYNLAEMESGAFDSGGSSIIRFDVSHAGLMSLDPGLLNWTTASSLNLAGNPWNCDCNLRWMKEILPENVTKTVMCTFPHQIKGQTLYSLAADSMSCSFFSAYRHRMGVGLVIATTLLFVLITTYLIYTYRQRIFAPCQKKASGQYQTLFNKEDADQADASVSIQWDKDASETEPLNNPSPAFV